MSLLPPIQGRGRRMAPGRDVVAGGERRVQTEYAKKNNQKSKSRLVGLLKSRPLSASGQQAFVAQRTKHEVRPSIRKHWCPALDAVAPTPERLPRAPQGAPRGCCHGAFFAGEALAASRPQRAVHAGPPAPRGPHGPPLILRRPHAFTKSKTRPAEKGRRISHRCSLYYVALAACSEALSPFQILKSPIRKLLGRDAPPATRAPEPFLKDFSRPMCLSEWNRDLPSLGVPPAT